MVKRVDTLRSMFERVVDWVWIGGLLSVGLAGCHLWTPASCITDDQRNQAWQVDYNDGWAAIDQKDYETAESCLLRALSHAEHFESNDRRLAETLDDLGLVYFSLGHDYHAELMQGRAVVQLLLAKGFNDPDLPVFITRLGYILAHQNQSDKLLPLKKSPYKIFELGYTTENRQLARRLDALIVEYERIEDFEAVDYLSRLVTRIRRHHAK